MANDHWRQLSKLIPNYEQVSLCRFRDLFLDRVACDDHPKIEHWLSDSTLLQFVHQQAALTCVVMQLHIEQSYWQYIAQLDMPAMQWITGISKALSKQNSLNWDHTKTKANIAYRQSIVSEHLERATSTLYAHLQQMFLYVSSRPMKDQTRLAEVAHLLWDGIMMLVQHSLFYFRTNFEQKRILLSYDLQAAHLVKSLYDLNPTEEQVSIHLM